MSRRLSRQFLRGLAAFTVVWTLIWIAVGIWVDHEVRTLRQLSTTVIVSGTAVRQTGAALQGLATLPLIGGDVDRIARQVVVAGANAQASGRESRAAVGRLALLLGVTVAAAPSLLMVALYLVTRRLESGERDGP